MSGYIPGSGRKRPLNNLEVSIFPDIRKAPPRFVWTKKHWNVDVGRTLAEVEHTPFQDHAILYQSYDYGRQHAYGKHPTYNAFTNKEFRPPLIERDDILPLSRIPRPVTAIRINPGTANPTGNNAFADQQNMLQGIEKYISNRVKEGQIRPTFFSPMEMPVDNSILPDLETKLPPTSASASFSFPSIGKVDRPDLELPYKQFHPSVVSDVTPIRLDARSALQDLDLRYNQPQVSASAGTLISKMSPAIIEPFTPIDLEYTNPQVSASAIPTYHDMAPIADQSFELYDQSPQISATAGFRGGLSLGSDITPIDYEFDTKTAGSQPAFAYSKGIRTFDGSSAQVQVGGDVEKMGKRLDTYSYVVPNNTSFKSDLRGVPEFRRKVASLDGYVPAIPQSSIPRKGVSDPNQRIRSRKDQK